MITVNDSKMIVKIMIKGLGILQSEKWWILQSKVVIAPEIKEVIWRALLERPFSELPADPQQTSRGLPADSQGTARGLPGDYQGTARGLPVDSQGTPSRQWELNLESLFGELFLESPFKEPILRTALEVDYFMDSTIQTPNWNPTNSQQGSKKTSTRS